MNTSQPRRLIPSKGRSDHLTYMRDACPVPSCESTRSRCPVSLFGQVVSLWIHIPPGIRQVEGQKKSPADEPITRAATDDACLALPFLAAWMKWKAPHLCLSAAYPSS
ncbi:hypothetical protein H0G86_007025 [Trichoderma simmonsii]|uniref:Uncharacterized protein n=1 Tax=Trichoderma simmonsii TaxID=1491479 RepID=A0A8G0LHN6_9HYPO|nr:hypothetical protein H0G86_007025 [Trichoderma simmonsii]